jgi:hypothetical protein
MSPTPIESRSESRGPRAIRGTRGGRATAVEWKARDGRVAFNGEGDLPSHDGGYGRIGAIAGDGPGVPPTSHKTY